jgi:hypothetical protein
MRASLLSYFVVSFPQELAFVLFILIERHRQWGPEFCEELSPLHWCEGPREITITDFRLS